MDEENIQSDIALQNGDTQDLTSMPYDDVEDVCEMVFKFEDQEGPLDVLWRLIKSTKLDIREVKLSDITEQFLDYVRALDIIDMERMSWFIREAAMLLEIKSRSLLPREDEGQDEEVQDDEEMYKRRLEMYRLFKETSSELGAKENVDRFYKEPEKSANDYRIVLKNMTMEGLVQAFSKLLVRIQEEAQPIKERQIKKDRFTLADSITNLKSTLNDKKNIKFSQLFANDFTRGEIIVTFLAVLQLLKAQFATAEQGENYGDIEIKRREGVSQDEQIEIEPDEYN